MDRVSHLLRLHYSDFDATSMLMAFREADGGITSAIAKHAKIMSPEEAVADYELNTSCSAMSICIDMMETTRGRVVKYQPRNVAEIETFAAKLGAQVSGISRNGHAVSFTYNGLTMNYLGDLRSIDEYVMSSSLRNKWMEVRTAYLKAL